MNRNLPSLFLFVLLFAFLSAPSLPVYASTTVSSTVATHPSVVSRVTNPPNTLPLEVSGWLPYWRVATGTADVLPHLSSLTEINPFGYIVKSDGTLNDAANISQSAWQTLFTQAKAKKVRIIPTVMWSDTQSIDRVLSNPTLRAAHVANIVAMVNQNNFDGVDIDYEGKLASTSPAFSAFLKQLYSAMGKKWVMCTIEAREPLDARFSGTPPADLSYANDLPTINKYCDRVRLMTYDQESADIQLNKQYQHSLYTPIADPAWVTKVVNYMAQDISRKKIEIGVATYGYDYQVMPAVDGSGYAYNLLDAFNPAYGVNEAKAYGITPLRNVAGELSFSYVPTSTPSSLPSNSILSSLAPQGTVSGNLVAAGALALASSNREQAPFHLLWWSDAQAMADKMALAKKLGVRGVAVFKFDGGEDQNIWNILAAKK